MENCQSYIHETQLEKMMDFEYFNKITDKVIFNGSIQCPGCQVRSDFMDKDEWITPCCNIRICKFCRAVDDEGKCQSVSTAQDYFNSVVSCI